MDDDIKVTIAGLEIFSASEGDPGDVLRPFRAEVLASDGFEDLPAGEIRGYVVAAHWDRARHDLRDAGDRYDADTELLGNVADRILEEYRRIDTAVLVELVILDEEWRGNRLARAIILEVLAVIGFDLGRTAVVLIPEPVTENGPLEPGPERDSAAARLQAAYREQGLEQYGGASRVWWLPPRG